MKILLAAGILVFVPAVYFAYARLTCIRPFGWAYYRYLVDRGQPAKTCVYVGFGSRTAPSDAEPRVARPAPPGIFYGQKISPIPGTPIFYPDLTLKFLGSASVPGPNGANFKMTTYRYSASAGDETTEVLWRTGTGDVGPVPFTLAGKSYELDRGWSEDGGEYVIVTEVSGAAASAESARGAALKMVEAKLLEKFPNRERDGHELELEYLEPVAGKPGQWAAKYDAENVMDAAVEIIVDVNAGAVVWYQDEWA